MPSSMLARQVAPTHAHLEVDKGHTQAQHDVHGQPHPAGAGRGTTRVLGTSWSPARAQVGLRTVILHSLLLCLLPRRRKLTADGLQLRTTFLATCAIPLIPASPEDPHVAQVVEESALGQHGGLVGKPWLLAAVRVDLAGRSVQHLHSGECTGTGPVWPCNNGA